MNIKQLCPTFRVARPICATTACQCSNCKNRLLYDLQSSTMLPKTCQWYVQKN